MKNRKWHLLFRMLLIIQLIILIFSLAGCKETSVTTLSATEETSAEESGKRVIINDTDQNLDIHLSFTSPISVQAHSKASLPDTLSIHSAATEYLVLATKNNNNNTVYYAKRYPASYFQNDSWTIIIPSLPDSDIHPLVVNNDSGENIKLYIGIWNGKSFSAAQIGEVSPYAKTTITNSHIALIDSDFCRIMAVSSENNMLVFSRWYTIAILEELDWQIDIPQWALWDGIESFDIDNRTDSELKIYVSYSNEIWRQSDELGYTYIGSIASFSSATTEERWVSGSSSHGYLTFIKAVNSSGETVFSTVKSMYFDDVIIIEPE